MAIFDSKLSSEVGAHKFGHVKYQFLATVFVNLITLSHGCMIGWLSPALLVLMSDDSPMNGGALTTEQVSWIGAILNVGALIGNFAYTAITSYFGRKKALCLLAVPNAIFWVVAFFARDVEYLYAARVIAGFTGGGMFICIPLYIAEIASDHVRGTLGSMLILSLNLGILIAYLVGAYLPYNIVPGVLLVFPILFLCGSLFLPDTPRFLMLKGRIEEAEKSLKFYKGCRQNTKSSEERFKIEMDKLVSYTTARQNAEDIKVTYKDFCTPLARRGMMIGCTMMCLNVFSGGLLMLNYASNIFKQSGSDLDPNTSAIIMISMQLLGTWVATFLIDRVGRRVLLIASTIGCGTGHALMGTFIFLSHQDIDLSDLSWVPVASLSMAVFMAAIGLLPLVFVVLGEVLPSKIRDLGSTLCLALISLFLLLITKIFPTLSEVIGLYTCFWFFACVCLAGLLFAIFILPETNGKNINAQ